MAARTGLSALPEPLVVVNIRGEQHFRIPKRWVHPQHHLSLFLRGAGYYRCGPMELPAVRPIITS